LNTFRSVFNPGRCGRAVPTLNALLGLGTALARVLVAAFADRAGHRSWPARSQAM
jgi:hypothetical protein